MSTSLQGCWRRTVACALIYALFLQGLIFATVLGQFGAHAANGRYGGFELCTHSANDPGLPVAPSPNPTNDIHCIFCISGAIYVNCAPPPAPQYRSIVLAKVVWPVTTPQLTAPSVNKDAWPRGPPTAI